MRWQRVKDLDELEIFYLSIIPQIKAAGKEMGYAIAVHGSMRRDLDLIAVPWVEDDFCDAYSLARVIHQAVCGIESQKYIWERKPNGRIATCFPICFPDFQIDAPSLGHIDLSVIGENIT